MVSLMLYLTLIGAPLSKIVDEVTVKCHLNSKRCNLKILKLRHFVYLRQKKKKNWINYFLDFRVLGMFYLNLQLLKCFM